MKLKYKILILLIITIGVLISVILVYQYIGLKQKKLFEKETSKNNEFIIDHALKNSSAIFEKFTKDYSGWSDMVNFISNPDSAWAVYNVDVLVTDYDMSFALLYDEDFNHIYLKRDSSIINEDLSIERKTIEQIFDKSPFCHFFKYFDNNLYEIFGAIIVHDDDFYKRETSPKGYMLNAKLWDSDYIKNLEKATSFNVDIIKFLKNSKNIISNNENSYNYSFELFNYQNSPVSLIKFSKENYLNRELNTFSILSLLISIVGVITIVLFLLIFQNIVLIPISKISKALDTDNGKSIEPLLKSSGEFKKLAVLILDFFKQKEFLKESNVILSSAIEQSPVTVLIMNKDGNIEFANTAFTKITGYNFDEIIGKNIQLLKTGKTAPEIFDNLWDTISSGKIWKGELINKKKNGELFYEETIISPVKNKRGSITNFIAIQTDITTRKQTEQALKESESKLNSLINNRAESIWSVDMDYNYVIFNNYYKNAYFDKFKVELKQGMNSLSILTPELIKFLKPKYDKAFSNQGVVFELLDQAEDGLNTFEVTLNPIVLDGKVTGVSGLSFDITKRKNAEDALKDSEEKLKNILDNMVDVIWSLSYPDFKPILISKSVEKIYGYSINHFFNDPMFWINLTHPDDRQSSEKSKLELERTGKSTRECRIICPNNEIKYIIDRSWLVYENNMPIRVDGITTDITIQKRAEHALKESENRLKELNTTKDKLFSIIAHDLRSPFSSILGFSDLLRKNFKNYNEGKSEELIKHINNSAKNTLYLLENLLSWANMQTGKINFDPVNINLNAVIQEIIDVLNHSAKIKNISLNNVLTKDITTFADQNMLQTILRNLVSNAIKYTPKDGTINISANSDEQKVQITVSDSGIGMNKETIQKLFSIETNFTTRGTANEKGSGLGLVLCKEFVEKHGGKIWIKSKVDKGSEFKFTLPLNKS